MSWKSKKTLKAESDLYFRLWQEAEADGKAAELQLENTRARLVSAMQLSMPAIWVLASNHRLARYELENRDVPSRHPRVRVITDEYQLHGHRVERGDKVIIIGHGLSARLRDEFEHLLHLSNVTMKDLWVAHV